MTATNAVKIEPTGEWGRFWPHITALIDSGGHVTFGRIKPIDGVAVAANERKVFASLKRRDGESVADLLQRLDDALSQAAHGGAVINEVNDGQFALALPSARTRR